MELEQEVNDKIARFIANNISDIKEYINEHQEDYEEYLKKEDLDNEDEEEG